MYRLIKWITYIYPRDARRLHFIQYILPPSLPCCCYMEKTYLAVHLVTSPPERAAPFPYSALHPVPAKMFSWDSVRRPSPAATAAFSYTSLESKAYSTGLETLGFSSKWASFEESDGGSYYPWSAEALGFSGAMAEARLRSNAVRLRSYHPAVATVAVEAEEKAVGFKLPFSTIARVDCKGVRAMIGERMFFIPSPLFSSDVDPSDERGYGASVIPRKPLLIMTKRNILEKNKNDGYGDLLPAFRGLKAPEKLVTPEEALFRGVKNRCVCVKDYIYIYIRDFVILITFFWDFFSPPINKDFVILFDFFRGFYLFLHNNRFLFLFFLSQFPQGL